ncbi:hypothetical protein GCM10027062_08410 [Nocardioides hungaricus]
MTRAPRLGVLIALLLATALLLPSAPSAPRAEPPGRGLRLSACVALGPIETVADLNRFVRRSPGVPALRGADVGIDVLLGDGRRLWLFADTLQSDSAGTRFVRNSALVVDGGCARAVSGPGRDAVIPDRADGVGYWPMSAFAVDRPGRTTVVVLAQRVRTVGTGPFDFETLGASVAVFGVPDGEAPRLRRLADIGPDVADPASPTWGAAVARERRWVYLYGTSTRPIAGVHGFALQVARSRRSHLADPGRWRYWDGAGWSTDPSRAARLIPERGGVSQTLSVFQQGGRWWAVSKQDEFLGTTLAAWPAPEPWGPFRAPTALLDIPCDPSTGELRYLALAHPDLLPRRGTVVVSWSRNNLDPGQVCDDPSRYRPIFRRVRLPAPGQPGMRAP